MACGASIEAIGPMVFSVRATGFAGAIHLGMNPDSKVKSYLRRKAKVTVHPDPCSDADSGGTPGMGSLDPRRWSYFKQWLGTGYYDAVWIVDPLETAFQQFPFTMMVHPTSFFLERPEFTPSLKAEVIACAGLKEWALIQGHNMPVVTNRVILGNRQTIVQMATGLSSLAEAPAAKSPSCGATSDLYLVNAWAAAHGVKNLGPNGVTGPIVYPPWEGSAIAISKPCAVGAHISKSKDKALRGKVLTRRKTLMTVLSRWQRCKITRDLVAGRSFYEAAVQSDMFRPALDDSKFDPNKKLPPDPLDPPDEDGGGDEPEDERVAEELSAEETAAVEQGAGQEDEGDEERAPPTPDAEDEAPEEEPWPGARAAVHPGAADGEDGTGGRGMKRFWLILLGAMAVFFMISAQRARKNAELDEDEVDSGPKSITDTALDSGARVYVKLVESLAGVVAMVHAGLAVRGAAEAAARTYEGEGCSDEDEREALTGKACETSGDVEFAEDGMAALDDLLHQISSRVYTSSARMPIPDKRPCGRGAPAPTKVGAKAGRPQAAGNGSDSERSDAEPSTPSRSTPPKYQARRGPNRPNRPKAKGVVSAV